MERKRKALIESSRTVPTENLVRLFGTLETPPKTFMSGSAVGYYGNRKDEQLTESSSPGEGFLANLAQQWEAAAAPAQGLGIRTVWMRTGIVTTPMGGALNPCSLPTLSVQVDPWAEVASTNRGFRSTTTSTPRTT